MPRIALQRTTLGKPLADLARPWYIIDAEGKTLGRLATVLARLLSGRDRVDFTPHIDAGAHIVVLNAGAVHVTGSKLSQKLYRHHTGFMGGLKEERLSVTLRTNPTKPIIAAVTGMLPKHSHRRAMLQRLHVYTGSEHPHATQQPKPITV